MKLLETEKTWTGDGFSSNPVILRQIKRSDHAAVYERWHDKGTRYNGCEVFVIKKRLKGQPLPGGLFELEDREVYPSANSFGKTAWHMARSCALQRFDELNTKAIAIEDTDDDEQSPGVDSNTPKRRGRQAKVRQDLLIPTMDFSVKDLAEFNKVEYADAVFFLKVAEGDKRIKFLREERGADRGPMSKIYGKA